MQHKTFFKCTAPIQQVIDEDLCIACGACIPACPKKVISPAYSEYRGAHEVIIDDHSQCTDCSSPCGDVCPSINAFTSDSTIHSRIGAIEQVYVGRSLKYQMNGVSSSGGIIREICHYFLSTGINVISLTEQFKGNQSVYRAGLLTEISELSHMPGSIYHSVSFLNAISILEENPGPFLFVSIPCHLEGLNKYIASIDPSLENKILLKLGIICGWMFSDHGIANFADAKDIREKVLDTKYRGEDKVGKLKVRTQSRLHTFDRRIFESTGSKLAFRSSFSTEVNRMRCRLCQNHTNIQSDISVGDAWLERKGSDKLSIIITRNAKGESIISELSKRGLVEVENGAIADIEESQSKNLVYGTTARQLALTRKSANKHIVNYQFADDTPSPVPYKKIDYFIENFKRHLLRSGNYRLYRFAYALSKIKSYAMAKLPNK